MRRLVALVVSGAVLGLIGALPVSAADLPVKAPPMVASPVFSWTGFYIGGHIGWGLANEDQRFVSTAGTLTVPVGTEFDGGRDAFLGGGQAGYNYQIQNWVLGVEGDWSWTNASTTSTLAGTIGAASTNITTAKTDWYATLTGRVGYANGPWLWYVKGGAAWTAVKYGGSTSAGAVTYAQVSDTRSGWVVGAGAEYAISKNWSAKLEYNYMDFGTDRYTLVGTPGAILTVFDVDTQVHIIKGGVNYRF